MIAISIIIITVWLSNAIGYQNDIIQRFKDLFKIPQNFKPFNCIYCMSFHMSLLTSLYFYEPITAITIACLSSILATLYERNIR